MPDWSAAQYLRFAGERTRACRDLAARIAGPAPRTIIDLGCGPGNSTAVLASRWPEARITGIDNSSEMIAAAREATPSGNWLVGDIETWAATESRRYDVVFSNAALQWTRDHAALFPKLLDRVKAGGVFAAQMPSGREVPAHRLMRELAATPPWRAQMSPVADWHAEEAGFYFDVLSPRASRLDLWETEYLHVLNSADDIVQWYRGTGMRPFLQALASEDHRARFAAEYLEAIRPHYPPQASGKVLFPFRRLFLMAAP